MIATAPTKFPAQLTFKRDASAPDLGYFRRLYPETVANFGTLPRREEWLRSIWEMDAGWREEWETVGGQRRAEEVVVRGGPPSGSEVEGEFDVIYAGGVTGLLHASVLACRYERRVLVFDAREVGRTGRDWNISEEELRELERAGLFTKEEIESAVVNRYRGGFIKFHDAASRVKAEPLWVNGVLDAAIDADQLLRLAAAKLRARAAQGSALVEGLRFVRAYVEPSRVTVETVDAQGRRRLFAARLFVDASSENSAIARQLGGGRALTHVCPTVGTVARGFARGKGTDEVDFNAAEILVSTEDARDHRQLVWGGFAGSAARGDYTTSLSFYDAVDSPADKSLLALFERYFESLPAYKQRGAQWRVEQPVFGHAPVFRTRGWRRGRRPASDDRVMLVGAAAGATSPLTFGGFGAHARNLRRLTHLTHLALEADLLDAASLSEVNACDPRVAARAASLAEFMRPTPKSAPSTVNETLNAAMAALHHLDERVRRELFQDRLSFAALRSLLGHTARLYPRIFARVREHLGARGTLCWLAEVAGAVWSERRGRAEAEAVELADESREEDPAREFARCAARYKNSDGAEE
jgi:lycopene cyclase CruA